MSALETAFSNAEAHLGTEVGVSNWITVDQPMIDQFAETTFDTQWIHVDPERAAAETPFGGTIAHGFLTLSLASRFAYDCFPMLPGQVMGINYGMNKLRFLMPVRAGARLRGRFTLQKVTKRSATDLLRENLLTIEIEGEKTPALVAEWLGLAIFED
ncbi:MaoC family dehydratase [Sulfitobacter mediterraneus]|jgi:acyl dehydratase|uniref:Acyl dehydratase n=1 Tax=Sulfitobacter mediterraneus TaxID=83219 RepID=A0A2T6C800_9RHOB|nr:MaoC family dehydratase [Sulfitobacter mediterraneus]KIN78975.1 MaoC family protein [Sulfitobacter mediterraneus KCTC 32188]MBM1312237.1 MaoC family dehydratase [Sulfitobacter mediterraneus]MBM1316140.1 MaoC family dehydratase [Sulfitobacter mediterraneus]MBM1324488.1 MaoC family dehydratase [Sulfitobacter mediterraneus]MBM1328422.1 MaoC family dehydratase [Sulfitobacter mediterraneus]